ncbi:MAG: heavy metal translocating P-type ATPase [Planctomycetaceae bacterium]
MATVSGGFLATGLVLGWVGVVREVTVALLAASALAGGWFVAPRAWRAARHRALDMNFLMAIAAVGAAAIGEWAEGASVLFLYSVAQLLEVWSMDQARNAIQSLMDLSPTEATVKRNGREETVSPSDVRLEELIIVRPGQKIPLDGDVVAGGSAVNQAPITGESIPVDKAPGDQVFAGSINEHGVLEIRVTKHVEETTLARIIHAVEESQASRAPSQSFVDRFARVYTPAVVVLAGAIWLLPPVLGLGSWGVWFYRALAILVIACPCALVISTPVSVVSALTRAAREGVLAKGGLHLENTAGVTVIAFDKTGTLTEARPVVTDLVPLNDTTSEDLLRVAAALERNSEHALARAIITEADARGVESAGVSEFKALFGRGVQAIMDGKLVFLGNERLLDEHGLDQGAAEPLIRRFQSEGKTAIILFEQSGLLGVIGIADRVRPAAKACITSLRAHGIERILMLTGDNEGTARAVASNLGIDEYKSDLLPADKVNIVRRLERDGERVAFVGDGVNDAPALAAASVGIALGAAGTDVAIETADVALMGDDLAKLPFLIALSRNMLRVVKQNIVFSIVVKLVVLVLAITGWATLWMAVAADMGASILVVANGLKLLKSRNVPFIA